MTIKTQTVDVEVEEEMVEVVMDAEVAVVVDKEVEEEMHKE